MNLSKLWILDPIGKNKPSVSLTIMVISIIFLLVTGTMQVLDMVKTTGPFLEFTYSSMALYFGRRFTFGDKKYTSEKVEEVNKNIE
jgi:hypothetical protein